MAKTSFELLFMTLWTLSALKGSSSFSTGAPDFLCKSMKPLHDAAGQPHDALPFTVTGDRATVPPGGVVTVTIAKRPEFARFPLRFQGILAVASDANGDVVSGMVTPPVTSGLKRQDCKIINTQVPDSAVTHDRTKLSTERVSFQWRAPSNAALGSRYTVRVTVVQEKSVFWVGVPVNLTIGNGAPPARPPAQRTSSTATSQNSGTSTTTQQVQGTTGVNTNVPSTSTATGPRVQTPSIPSTSTSTATGSRMQPPPPSSPSPASSAIPQNHSPVGSRFPSSPDSNMIEGPTSGQDSSSSSSNARTNRTRGRGNGGRMQAWLSGWFTGRK